MWQIDVLEDKVFGHQNVKDSGGTEKVQNHREVAWSIGQTEGLLAIVKQALATITLQLHSTYLHQDLPPSRW